MILRFSLLLFTVMVMLFLIAPILMVIPLSFTSSNVLTLPVPGYSLQWYEDFFLSSKWLTAMKTSFVAGLATMFAAGSLGTLAAFGIHYSNFRGKNVVMAALILPLVVPVIVTAMSMYLAFSVVGLSNSLTGLILAHTIIAAPYVVITVLASLQTFDMNLLRAALSLGANPVTAFREIVLPMILPGVITGAIFAFAISFDELVIAIFIAGPEQLTLPRQMFSGLRETLSPTASVAAVIMIFFSFVMLLVSEAVRRVAERRNRDTK